MKKILCLLLSALMIVAVFSGCTSKDAPVTNDTTTPSASGTPDVPPTGVPSEPVITTPEAPEQIGVLTIAITRDENSLTPITYVTGSPGFDIMKLMYDSLFTISAENTVIPWMVSDDFEISADQKTFTMMLLDGQMWHDGTPLTGEDVAFTFDYYKNTFTHSRWTAIAKQVESVTVSGNEIVITLESANPGFLRAGLADLRIIAKHQFEGVADPTELPNMGSGAFRQTEYKTAEYYTLEAMDSYFRGTPGVKTIRMPIMDSSSAQQTLLAGELATYTGGVSVELLNMFDTNPDITVERSDGYGSTLLLLNCERTPFDNADFRRALSLAVNLDQIIDQVMLGYGTKGTAGYVRSGLDEFNEGLDYTYDVAAANELLDSIGYTEKDSTGLRLGLDGKPMKLELLTSGGRSRIAEFLIQHFAAIGIDVEITSLDGDALDLRVWPDFDTSKPHDYDMAMFGWSAPVVQRPGAIVGACSSDYSGAGGQNLSHYVNAEFDALAEQFRSSVDSAERLELNKQMQQIAARDIPFITIYFSDSVSAVNTAMYSGWVFAKGGNAVNVFSFLPK